MGSEQFLLTYEDALAAITAGETDWNTLTQRVGRNDLPGILIEIAWSMTDDDLAEAMRETWVSAESPENALGRDEWIDLFDEVGYRHNSIRAEPPSEIVLWRGGITPDRMAWTADRALAEWFRDRYPNGKLWTVTAPASSLLAFYDGVRTGDGSGQGESEYVINPEGLQYHLLPQATPADAEATR